MEYDLTQENLDWLKVNQPGLTFDRSSKTLSGVFKFSCQYENKEVITDSYEVKISFKSTEPLPMVYETGGKIRRTAMLQGKPLNDLHQYDDNHLCLIRWDKMKDWYKDGFDFETFMGHLETHFYWLSYVYRYNTEPWPADPHGWPNLEMQLKYE